MKKVKRKITLGVLVVGILVSFFAAKQIKKSVDILRVGVTANYPPIIFKQDGQYEGLDVELARMFSQRLNKKIKFVELPWIEQLPALLDKKIDIIISGMSITPSRKEKINFSETYLRIGQMALVRKEDTSQYQTKEMILNAKASVGVEKGTSGEEFVKEEMAQAHIISYVLIDRAMNDLLSGKIDIYIHDAPEIWWLSGEYEDNGLVPIKEILNEEFLACGVRKENKKLLKEVNQALKEWKVSKRLDQRIMFWVPFVNFYLDKNDALY